MAHLVFGEPGSPHSMQTCWECISRHVTPEGEPLTNLCSSDSLRHLNLGYCDEWWMKSVGVQSQHQQEPNVRLSTSLLPLKQAPWKQRHGSSPMLLYPRPVGQCLGHGGGSVNIGQWMNESTELLHFTLSPWPESLAFPSDYVNSLLFSQWLPFAMPIYPACK